MIGRVSFLILFVACVCGCAVNPSFVKTDRSKGYVINGKTYYPMKCVKASYKQNGVASWYGPGFHGRKTASGEVYNMNDLTAAHSELPLNTLLRVTNLKNKKEVLVRVNDRGPFVGDRVIDMSFAAANELGMLRPGTVPVKLEVMETPIQLALAKKTPKGIPAPHTPVSPNPYYAANARGFLALLRN
jgi:rare lipoprotein A